MRIVSSLKLQNYSKKSDHIWHKTSFFSGRSPLYSSKHRCKHCGNPWFVLILFGHLTSSAHPTLWLLGPHLPLAHLATRTNGGSIAYNILSTWEPPMGTKKRCLYPKAHQISSGVSMGLSQIYSNGSGTGIEMYHAFKQKWPTCQCGHMISNAWIIYVKPRQDKQVNITAVCRVPGDETLHKNGQIAAFPRNKQIPPPVFCPTSSLVNQNCPIFKSFISKSPSNNQWSETWFPLIGGR